VIVDVEREEAEWALETLEGLFMHCSVESGESERRTRKLREKLARTRGQGGGRTQAGQKPQRHSLRAGRGAPAGGGAVRSPGSRV